LTNRSRITGELLQECIDHRAHQYQYEFLHAKTQLTGSLGLIRLAMPGIGWKLIPVKVAVCDAR
jgi:hypothetical protein